MVYARTILWYFVLSGFALNTMLKSCMNFTIIAMIKPHSQENTTSLNDTKLELSSDSTNASQDVLSKIGGFFDKDVRYDWDEKERGLILGAPFWLQWTTQVPAGILVRSWGSVRMVGFCTLFIILINFAIPFVASLGAMAVVAQLALQGIVAGTLWPSIQFLAAQWVPANERSKFAFAYSGNTIGIALTYPLCGLLISYFSWQSVFFVTGFMGLVWCSLWFWCVYDSPLKHPTISKEERDYIINHTNFSRERKRPAIPWGAILTSRPFIINILAHWGAMWGCYTLVAQVPTYFKQVHRINVKTNGFYSGFPYVCKTFFAYFYSLSMDKLLKSNRMSRTAVRKLATFVSTILQGLLVIGLSFSSASMEMAFAFLVLATMVHGAMSSGPLSSLLDLSPNFASILQGISGTINVSSGFLSPLLFGYLTYNNQSAEQWQLAFNVSAAIMVGAGLIHLIFGDSTLQPWNEGKSPRNGHIKYELAPTNQNHADKS